MAPVAALADQVRKDRKPVAADNPFVAMQETASRQIVVTLDVWRDLTEAMAERTFLAVYGSPTLQAAVGVDPASTHPMRKAPKDPLHSELLQKRIAELEAGMREGGLRAAVIRGILYVGMPRASIDERGAAALRRIREAHTDLTLSAFKVLVREQYNMLLIDQEAALAAIPSMLPPDTDTRVKAFDLIRHVLTARGAFSGEESARLSEIARLFGIEQGGVTGPTPFRQVRSERPAKAS
jgi:hypothetical protein